mgnify:FL=1
MEVYRALAAFWGVLLFGTLQGILVAIVLSMLALASQALPPPVRVIGRKRGADVLRPVSPEHPDDETFPGLLILRPEGRLFFANAELVGDRIREFVAEHQPRVLMLDLSRVSDIESSAPQMLCQGERRLAEQGLTLWLAGLNPDVLDDLCASDLADRLGTGRLLINTRAGIERYLATATPPRPLPAG